MAMSLKERMRKWTLLKRDYTSCNHPSSGNTAISYDEYRSMAYAGVVLKWPLVVFADSESSIVDQMDALSPPLAGKKVRFYSRIATEESKPAEETDGAK
jgi:hypothetical protein